jgi:xanthine dehydrogenase accessory factor
MERLLLDAIAGELRAGKRCMLATIIARRGSAPRGVGTSMLVSLAGEQTGTVGGGLLEHHVKLDALALLEKCACAVREYEIHADDKMAHSGGVTILFRPLAGETGIALAQKIRHAFDSESEAYLVCQILEGCARETTVLAPEALCSFCDLSCAPEQPLVTQGEPRWLIEPLMPAPRVILFGGGHVAQCMARQLDLLDYRTWVVEDREAFAVQSLFPTAERVIFCDYDRSQEKLTFTKRDHAIVMSRGHETDYQILRWLLRTEADYIGCIGSSKKIALTKERLLADGLSSTQIARMHAPVGLAIGAETPAEIAVSIAAELIRHRSCKNAK